MSASCPMNLFWSSQTQTTNMDCSFTISKQQRQQIKGQIKFFFFFQSVLSWRVVVSTICCHKSRVVAFLQAVAKAEFRGPRSASVARSQVWLGLPTGLPVGWYVSDSHCKGSVVILARWTASNMAEEPQMPISHQVRKRWTSSDFRIWHVANWTGKHNIHSATKTATKPTQFENDASFRSPDTVHLQPYVMLTFDLLTPRVERLKRLPCQTLVLIFIKTGSFVCKILCS